MSFDTRFVDYLIIGAHTSLWLLLVVMAILGVPISVLFNVDAGVVLLFLPFVYLIGMLFDSTAHFPLEPFRRRIRDSVFRYEKYKDEFIAYSSPELYSAYEVRVRRVRILGAAIFNWPLFGVSLILHLGFGNPRQYISVIVVSALLCVLTTIAWHGLYRRAYKFRKNAIDTIRGGSGKTSTTTVTKK